jgi:predicted nuclease of predicted toxin-antitoxin system
VLAVCEFAKRLEDADVIDLSVRKDCTLITEDKDFGQLVFAHGHGTRGVILVRFPATARRRLPSDLVRLVEQKKQALRNSFVVLEPGRFRVARLPPAPDV